jgi:hypothetical protein
LIFRQDELTPVVVLPGAKRSRELLGLRCGLVAITMRRGYGRDSIVLSDEEKRELREMAASVQLREEFRTLRRNSRTTEGRISVDELAHWLTGMARVCPGDQKPRRMIPYSNVKF